ncbi:MAG TPA: ectoine/hydroxyectoine ABC transporter permease subunit EhuC [Candidatus Sulfomarinibacteraceae bacterium]|nr:ectoine/hydroxyectoine ABC transporter permease subunit EhuC [Candidatus Sulfomarinibacteraceae bacterium]
MAARLGLDSDRIKNMIFLTIAILTIGTAFGVQMMTNPPELAPFDLMPTLLRGLSITITLTFWGALLALVVAIFTGILRASDNALLRGISGIYVEVFRGTSILVQLFWIYFVLPLPPFEISITAFQAGVLALGLNVGAYGAEVVRGAIQAIPRGQIEAATALNMSRNLMMRRVILPQAIVRILPPFGNLLIELLKATSLASLITLSDVTFQALTLRQSVGRTTEVFILLLFIYFLIAYPLTLGVRWLERQRRWVA